MLRNRSVPQCSVIPELAYPDVGAAIDWLCEAFGFTIRLRIANHRAQLNVGDGAIVLTSQEAMDAPCNCSIMVRVGDVDRHHAHAMACGALVMAPPAGFPYGERQYTVKDPTGHHWTFTQSIADVDPGSWGGTAGLL